jgi:hypothetical protein
MVIARGNRLNNSGSPELKGVSRTAQIISTAIPAGQTLTYAVSGNNFYLIAATAPLAIRPAGGAFNHFTSGKGMVVDDQNLFNKLEVFNDSPYSVVFSLFVGFGGYIDNTLILNTQMKQVVYPTAPLTSVGNLINIPDLTGQAFTDINGNPMLALSRTGIYVSNYDIASTYSLEALQPVQTLVANARAVAVAPGSDIVYPAAGNFRIWIPASTINAVVSEIYSAIAPTNFLA